MSGSIVTSSGDHHRGFHQCPNVLRDKYMPIIGGDGYGYINYLMSWANANATLSVRRMKKDLGWSQDKLQRVQQSVLKHCGHFVSLTPGDAKTANQWHLDMELLWAENAVHLAQSYAERLAKRPVPEIGTPHKTKTKPVPEIGTPPVPESGTPPVPEIGTYKDNPLNTSEKTSSSAVDANARPGQGPDDDDLSPDGSQKEAARPETLEGGEGLPLSVTSDQMEGTKLEHATSSENVPGGAAGGLAALKPIPRAELAARTPRDPEGMTVLRALLSASHKSRLPYLKGELAGATRSGIPMELATRLTDAELEQARDAAKADTTPELTFASAARRAVERLIGEGLPSSGPRGIETRPANLPQQIAPAEPEPERPADTIEIGTRWEHKKIDDKIVTIVEIAGGKIELHNGETILSYVLVRDYKRVN